jgi:hypothetical protein
MWINQLFNVFLRVNDRRTSIELGITASVKNGVLYVVLCLFGHVEKILGSVDRLKDRNHALSPVSLLLGA